jgi:hypothetical protein
MILPSGLKTARVTDPRCRFIVTRSLERASQIRCSVEVGRDDAGRSAKLPSAKGWLPKPT